MCRSSAVVRLVVQQFDLTHISNCWARPRDLQKTVYFNWESACRKVWEPLVYVDKVVTL